MTTKSGTHNVVPKLYGDIIKDVINSVRDDFMNESIDESVLEDLNKLWQKKLDDTGATKGPNKPKDNFLVYVEKDSGGSSHNTHYVSGGMRTHGAHGIATSGNPRVIHGGKVNHVYRTPGSSNSTGTYVQSGKVVIRNNSNTSRIQQPVQRVQKMIRTGNVVHSTAPVNNISTSNIQRQGVIKQNVITASVRRPTNIIQQSQPVHQTVQQQQPVHQSVQQQQPVHQTVHQQQTQRQHENNHVQYSDEYSTIEPSYVNNQYLNQTDGPVGDDFDSDSSQESDDEEDQQSQQTPETQHSPLGSDDDLDGADDDETIFETDNQIVCQYDKIQRVKNRWRFCLKDGIMHLNGKDYVFQKATGEGDW